MEVRGIMKRSNRVLLMTSLSLLTFVFGVAVVKFQPHFHKPQPTAWQTLLLFENQDLANLRPESALRIEKAIETLTALQASMYEPRLFRTIENESGETRYVLVEEQPLLSIPGDSRLRIHIFDQAGHLLSQTDFSAGWRTFLRAMTIRKYDYLNHDVLEVYGAYCFGGSSSTQYYVLVGNSIVLAYLEEEGKFQRNDYSSTNLTVGPVLSQRTADEWEAALNSTDTPEVTAALMWLGGIHWDGQPAPYDEDKPEAEKVSQLLARASIRKRLNELSKSSDWWIVLATKHVLDPNSP
jgi:hypothetical protein